MPESKLLMDIGDRLRARREKMGLTQKQTAKLLGISERDRERKQEAYHRKDFTGQETFRA